MLIRIFISICNIPFYLLTVFVLCSSEISMENILYHGYIDIYDLFVELFPSKFTYPITLIFSYKYFCCTLYYRTSKRKYNFRG